MAIKELKEKLSNIDFATGAKKVALGIALTSVIGISLTATAHAAIPASNILGDAQVGYATRVEIKEDDAKDIHAEFCAYDYYGNPVVNIEEIRQAIELSDALNGYYYDELYFTNTNKSEVLNLDIDELYRDYQYAQLRNREERFCSNNMGSKPALDAYITFSCGSVANGIKEQLSNALCRVLIDEGYKITSTPRLTINNNKLYAVIGLNTGLRVIEIKGEQVPEMINTILAMNNTYNVSLNNIAGYSSEYEASFAYNGVDKYTNESVWLSLPDDTKKANLSNGITMYETLCNDRGVILECSNPFDLDKPSKSERSMLENLGYTSNQAKQARVQEVTITLLDKTYTK